MLEHLTKINLAENLHTQFRLHLEPDQASQLELVELNDARTAPDYEAFALLFRGDANDPLDQGMYRMEHATLGTFDLFIVPVAQDPTGRYYEAVFNRPLSHGG